MWGIGEMQLAGLLMWFGSVFVIGYLAKSLDGWSVAAVLVLLVIGGHGLMLIERSRHQTRGWKDGA